MGQALITCARNFREIEVVGQIDKGDDLKTVIQGADVVVDFSFHEATAEIAELCVSNKKALVIGTTGHSDADQSKIKHQTSRLFGLQTIRRA